MTYDMSRNHPISTGWSALKQSIVAWPSYGAVNATGAPLTERDAPAAWVLAFGAISDELPSYQKIPASSSYLLIRGSAERVHGPCIDLQGCSLVFHISLLDRAISRSSP